MKSAPSSPADRRVLFVSMPWARPERPSLGLGTLKAILDRDGIASDVLPLGGELARRTGLQPYTFFAVFGFRSFCSEIFFTPYYFQLDPREFFDRTLAPHLTESYPEIVRVAPQAFPSLDTFLAYCRELALQHVPSFLAAAARQVRWSDYDVVGFTLTFEQTLSSLCLAAWLKEHHPEIVITFGGPTCEGEMGEEILRSFACVDVVALGEADQTITPLIRSLRAREPLAQVPGIAYREDGAVRTTEPPPLLRDLDWLPVPSYDGFWPSVEGLSGLRPKFFFETSRGCWWGQKSLCTFCGLNAGGLTFRRKTPERVLAEILEIESRYGVRQLAASDNILDHSYYQTVLPRLREINGPRPDGERLSIFYEVKTPVRKEHVALLVEAGVDTVQPGIETFSDAILARMKKGNSAMQQIQFLRWSAELGLAVYYGLIHSNPADEVGDYEEMLRAIDFVDHLPPPSYVTPLALDRFSPYHSAPAAYGIRNVRPSAKYLAIFPDRRIDHARLAYRFDFDHDLQRDAALQDAIARLQDRVSRWKREYRRGSLTYVARGPALAIRDQRRPGVPETEIAGPEAEIFLYCDEHRGEAAIARRFPELPAERIDGFLNDMLRRRWMFRDTRGHWLSLPTAAPSTPEPPAS